MFSLSISKSTFKNTHSVINIRGSRIQQLPKSSVNIQDSIFSKTDGISIMIEYMEGSASIHNCTFHNNWRSVIVFKTNSTNITSSVFRREGTTKSMGFVDLRSIKNIFVSRCSFFNGSSSKNGGCVTIARRSNTAVFEHCNFTQCQSRMSGGALSLATVRSEVIIRQSIFVNNRARKMGGAIVLVNRLSGSHQGQWSHITIKTCSFINNEARIEGQTIRSSEGLNLKNILIFADQKTSVSQLHLVGALIKIGDLKLVTIKSGTIQSSLTFSGITVASNDFQVIGEIYYKCPRYFNMISYKTWNTGLRNKMFDQFYTSFVARCESCPSNQYTLTTGILNVHRFIGIMEMRKMMRITKWSQNITKKICLPCPAGARCNGNIVPLDNHWGYRISHNRIAFSQCPNGYCCSSQGTMCSDFNTCEKGRTGILCGSCDVGYAHSFVTNGCIKKNGVDCNLGMFLVYSVIASFIYTVVFTFSSSLIEILKRKYASCRGQAPRHKTNAKSTKGDEQAGEIFHRNTGKDEEESLPPFTAYIVIVMFFFQVAGLIHVEVPKQRDADTWMISFRSTLFNLVNFRFTLYRQLCPMDDLELPMKELFYVCQKIFSILNLLIFLITWKFIRFLRKMILSSDSVNPPNETIELHVDTSQISCDYQQLSLPSLLKIGYIKLLKLYLTSLFAFTFHMIHCVKIESHSHLYLYGDHECYSNWQYIIIFVAFPLVLLTPASFGVSINLLREGMISSNTFLLASTFPCYAMWLCIKKKLVGLHNRNSSHDERLCVAAILQMEEDLFKPNKIHWPTVQLYRNFLVVILNSLILNPIYRSITFIPLFLVFLRHDCTRMPYKHPFLNQLQALSSSCFLVISACNFPASIVIMTNAMSVPFMGIVILALQYLEMTIYAVVPLYLVAWALWTHCDRREMNSKEE